LQDNKRAKQDKTPMQNKTRKKETDPTKTAPMRQNHKTMMENVYAQAENQKN
jgi:hypothetical protein